MEVECIGNTQIIHMEETGIFQRTIGLWSMSRLSHQPSKPAYYFEDCLVGFKILLKRTPCWYMTKSMYLTALGSHAGLAWGHSITAWTIFFIFLPLNSLFVDNIHPIHGKNRHFVTTYPPTSSCLRSLWTTPLSKQQPCSFTTAPCLKLVKFYQQYNGDSFNNINHNTSFSRPRWLSFWHIIQSYTYQVL